MNSPGGIYGDDGYINGDPSAGIQGSIPTFQSFEQAMRELQNFVIKSGLTPDDVMNGIQIAQAVQNGKVTYSLDQGTPNALSVALDPTPVAYTVGLRVLVKKMNAANTGAATINVNGLGLRNIVRSDGATLMAGGNLLANSMILLAYDGISFQVIGGGNFRGQSFDQGIILFNGGTNDWAVPANVFALQVEGWGGGGGGGAGNGTYGGGGGAGGGYQLEFVNVLPGQTIRVTVGAGGLGSNVNGNGGAPGGTTLVTNLTLSQQIMSVLGGSGGAPPLSGTGSSGGSMGTGIAGGSPFYGMDGSGGFPHQGMWGNYGAPGGPAPMSRGYSMSGNNGLAPGGGGCGNQADNFYSPGGGGVNGANGQVTIRYIHG